MKEETYYEIIVDTNQFTGNFSYEIAGYVFGCKEDVGHQPMSDCDPAGRADLDWAYGGYYEGALIKQYNPDFSHEYWTALAVTPGTHQNNSISFRFMDFADLDKEKVEAVRKRVEGFPAAYYADHEERHGKITSGPAITDPLRILGVRARKVTIRPQIEELDF